MKGQNKYTTASIKDELIKFSETLGNHDFRFSHLRESSVLVPLIILDGVVHILLTKRSKKLRTHAGAVAFPGGVKDKEDIDDIDTALREAEEEIGLKRENVDVVCTWPPSFASPMMSVVPVVCIIKNEFTPIINPDEVDCIFYVPLDLFTKHNCEKRYWTYYDRELAIYYFRHVVDGETFVIYGLTALISMIVSAIIVQKSRFIPALYDGKRDSVDIEEALVDYYYYCGNKSKHSSLGAFNERSISIKSQNSKL